MIATAESESAFAPNAPAVKRVSKRWLSKEELTELMRIKPALWIRDLAVTWAVTLGALEGAILAGQRLPLLGWRARVHRRFPADRLPAKCIHSVAA